MKAIIVDDEMRGAQSLQKILHHIAPDIEVLALAHNGAEGIEAIKLHKPSLVFLDIQMPDMTGFDMLQKLDKVNFSVVFTTAYDEFALKAFRFAAVDYLLKPIDIDDLSAAIQKVKQFQAETASENKSEPLGKLFSQLQKPGDKKLALPTSDGLLFVPVEEVISLEAASNYTFFFTEKNGKIVVSKTLGDFEEILEANDFFRVHNSHLINLHKIEKYVKGDGGYVIMKTGSNIEVSRRRKDDFMKRLEKMDWKIV
ncbi:MAG: LytTR family DNA-binding domain-containing protein [Ferruginibacter sp.]